MNIDLNKLNNSNIDISGKYNIPKEYYDNSDVIELNNVEVDGEITLDEDENEMVNCTIKGNMTIPDTISLEENNNLFKIEYNYIIPKK